ncbi:helix-turn-helix domain-containing protein [Cupriavidus necator]|uniref:Helix-turn-helix domain-containing protein n=1 Tax=Cupriavidus necator TaxID=106590 RepID=A0A1U9UJ96_CUPNE|nr:helix-turn-helix transcriptional regulator [Cupriavidus necator]AQV92668.1 helix-turn-helix domain-containing protein [Cupriavidus necator]
MTRKHLTLQEMEAEIGGHLRTYRIHRNIDQATLSERAGISVRALRNLEAGNGSSLRTLCTVLRALGREAWLDTIAPVPTINPLMLTRQAKPRQRASKPRKKKPTFNEALAAMPDGKG